jgi:hypothetical protein
MQPAFFCATSFDWARARLRNISDDDACNRLTRLTSSQQHEGRNPRRALRLFILRSKNKIDGTADIEEHRTSPFVVGAGNADT